MRRQKPKIDWKVAPEQARTLRLPPHIRDVPPTDDLKRAMAGRLEPGCLWRVVRPLSQRVYTADVMAHPLPVYEMTWFGNHVAVQAGNIAIYAGVLRVEELGQGGQIRVPRHTFIINDVGRVIIPDLNLLYPL